MLSKFKYLATCIFLAIQLIAIQNIANCGDSSKTVIKKSKAKAIKQTKLHPVSYFRELLGIQFESEHELYPDCNPDSLSDLFYQYIKAQRIANKRIKIDGNWYKPNLSTINQKIVDIWNTYGLINTLKQLKASGKKEHEQVLRVLSSVTYRNVDFSLNGKQSVIFPYTNMYIEHENILDALDFFHSDQNFTSEEIFNILNEKTYSFGHTFFHKMAIYGQLLPYMASKFAGDLVFLLKLLSKKGNFYKRSPLDIINKKQQIPELIDILINKEVSTEAIIDTILSLNHYDYDNLTLLLLKIPPHTLTTLYQLKYFLLLKSEITYLKNLPPDKLNKLINLTYLSQSLNDNNLSIFDLIVNHDNLIPFTKLLVEKNLNSKIISSALILALKKKLNNKFKFVFIETINLLLGNKKIRHKIALHIVQEFLKKYQPENKDDLSIITGQIQIFLNIIFSPNDTEADISVKRLLMEDKDIFITNLLNQLRNQNLSFEITYEDIREFIERIIRRIVIKQRADTRGQDTPSSVYTPLPYQYIIEPIDLDLCPRYLGQPITMCPVTPSSNSF